MFRTSHILFKLALFALVVVGLFMVYLDARITATFSEKMWELSARVYARPLELFAGAALTPEELAYELEVLGYRVVPTPRHPGEVSRNQNRFDLYARGFNFPGEQEPERRVSIEFSAARVKAVARRWRWRPGPSCDFSPMMRRRGGWLTCRSGQNGQG